MERFADRYLLLRSLGRGGMGEVFLARDLGRGTECALKRLTADAPEDSAELFRKEFARHAAVHHPAIAQVYERGVAPDGTHYITMEYVPGLHADHALVAGDWNGFAFVATRVAAGLEALHAAGVLHGDLKPSNILVVPASGPGALPSSVRIVDFGLAGLIDRDAKSRQGTPGYVAPEVVRGQPPDVASDLYGLGATLYHVAAGRAPYADEKPQAVLRRQQEAPPPALPLEEAGCPQPMIELILRLMAVSPGERPQSAGEVRREIERIAPAARLSLADRLASAVVVGRERELGLIERRLAETDRRTRVLLVSGEPGAGKSSLLRELATRAALRDRSVIHCSGASAPAQGAAAIEVLRLLAAGAPEGEADRAVRERLSDPDATLTEREVAGLVDAAVGWMRGGAGARMFLLDDAEQMDALSRTIVRRLMLHPDAPHSLWVLARRGDARALAEDEALMIRGGAAQHLPLRDLERESVTRLVASRLADTPPPALVEFLWDRAAGHPGLTVELLRNAAEAGALQETEAGLTLERTRLDALRALGGFEDSLLARVRAMPETARAALAALAIWNRPVMQERLLAMEPDADDAALDAVLSSGLAARDDSGRFALRPPALAARIVEAIPEATAERLHRALLAVPGLPPAERFEHLRVLGEVDSALAEAERGFADGPDVKLAVAAAELAAASRPVEAAAWLDRAAHELFQRGRVAEVIPLAERALELEPEGEAKFERWSLLAMSQQRTGAADAALRIVSEAGRADLNPIQRDHLRVIESSALLAVGQIDRALVLIREVLDGPGTSADPELNAAALLNHSVCLIQLKRWKDAREATMSARAVAAAHGNVRTQASATGNLAIIETLTGHRDAGVALSREAVEIARRGENQLALLTQLTGLGGTLFEAGQWKEARARHTEAFRLGIEQGLHQGTVNAALSLVHDNSLSGRPAEAVRFARTALRLARVYLPRLMPDIHRGWACADRATGRLGPAQVHLRRAMSTHPASLGANVLDWSAVERARLLLVRGHATRAAAVAGARLDETTSRGVGPAFLAALLGVALLRSGRAQEATDALRRAVDLAGKDPAPYAEGMIQTLTALLHFAGDRRDEGVRASERALRVFDQLPAPPDRAWAAHEIARVAVDMAEPPSQTGVWLERSARIFERLGDHRSRSRALTLQIRWLRRQGTAAGTARDEHRLIEQVGAMLASFSEPQEVAQRAMRMVAQQLGAERGSLLIIDRESNRLIPVADIGALDAADRKEVLNYSRQVVKRVTESGVGLITGDASTDPGLSSPSIRNLGLRSIVCVPVHLGGRVIGAIYLDDSQRTGAFSEQDQSLLEGLSHLMAIAIERSRDHVEILNANERLVDENLDLRRQVSERHQMDVLVGVSTQMRRVIAEVEQAATNDARVLITGEMGTGKELIARTLHYRSKRRLQPFVMLNCGAITESLLASELFGILPNVATDVKARPGRFVEANGGTLFLDEVGEMPMAQQVALLSVLSSPSTKVEVIPVGGGKPVPVDVRVIAATNQDLQARIREGRFREDLYYRLAVIPIEIPPLRERKADVQPLAARFLKDLASAQERPVPEMSPEFVAALLRSDWPGNVRELQNYLERVLSMTPGKILHPRPLPRDLEDRAGTVQLRGGRHLGDMVAELERKLIREALDRANGNQSRAARELGLTEQSMRYKIRKYKLESAREKQRSRH